MRTVQKEQVTNLYRLPEISEPELKALDRPLKIAYSRQHPRGGALSKDAANALETSHGALRALGHTLEEVALDVDQEAILHYYYLVMGLESGKLVREAEATGKKVRWGEVDPLVWVAYQLAPHVPATAYSDFNAFQDQLFEYMELLYQDYDIYLTPTVSDVAMKNADLAYPPALLARIQEMDSLHASEVWDVTKATFDYTYLRTSYNQLMNITGQPAISLPLFENADGLPLGTQLAAKRGDEYVLLQLAAQLEAAGYLKAGNVEM
ncbi:hypothetical protein CL176_06820 [Suicoccus acidiformans]|uniref:Amidase domain-containing protein n=1 Tax=Suicoccus acidiformans TaxID=2036206 RepID=A0A347WKX7_9LACT|nr:hypothetical protein CL176_06820 [Suicoccus acidiformans]